MHDDRLIIYGCGDFLNDYEGIEGYEEFRGDLALMYIVSVDHAKGELVETEIIPLQISTIPARSAIITRRWLAAANAGSGKPEIRNARRDEAGRTFASRPIGVNTHTGHRADSRMHRTGSFFFSGLR